MSVAKTAGVLYNLSHYTQVFIKFTHLILTEGWSCVSSCVMLFVDVFLGERLMSSSLYGWFGFFLNEMSSWLYGWFGFFLNEMSSWLYGWFGFFLLKWNEGQLSCVFLKKEKSNRQKSWNFYSIVARSWLLHSHGWWNWSWSILFTSWKVHFDREMRIHIATDVWDNRSYNVNAIMVDAP